jgi:hypothetical protein
VLPSAAGRQPNPLGQSPGFAHAVVQYWFVPSLAQVLSPHIELSVHAVPSPPSTPGPGTQRPSIHASVVFGHISALVHGGPIVTITVAVPGVPCASVAVTSTVCGPAASVAGALNANGPVIKIGLTATPSTVSATIVIAASAVAVTLTGKPACTLAPCFGLLIVTFGFVGVPAPNKFVRA